MDKDVSSSLSLSGRDINFQDSQITFNESNKATSNINESAYSVLKGDFEMLCKCIDGNQELIEEWKGKFTEDIGISAEKLNASSTSLSNS
eukprot:10292071-Ditylum_brightwellii.AAC.1